MSSGLGERNCTADVLIQDGEVLLSESREFSELDVAICDRRIDSVEPDLSHLVGEQTDVVDGSERYVVPGFIDAHTHLDYHQTIEGAYHRSLESGTTGAITETSGIAASHGADGIHGLLAASEDLPFRIFPTVPPQAFFSRFDFSSHFDVDDDRLLDLLGYEQVVGVGEVDWIFVVPDGSPERLFAKARAEDKPICGHGAGCSGRDLLAFSTTIDNDHEAIHAPEVEARLANGIHVIGRSGSGRDDVGAIVDSYAETGPGPFSLATDGLSPSDLRDDGHMDAVVRRAIDAGVDPVDALVMASSNTANHFGLDELGTIEPGSLADIAVLNDIYSVDVSTVLVDGQLVMEEKELDVGPRTVDHPGRLTESVNLSISPDELSVPTSSVPGDDVVAIEYGDGFVTGKSIVTPPRESDVFTADPDEELLLASIHSRYPGNERSFTGFITGMGDIDGAVATSSTWETPGVLVVGTDVRSMHTALERVDEIGGGWVIVRDDKIIEELPTPVGGIAAGTPLEETAARFERLQESLMASGIHVDRPVHGFETLTFPGVPVLKLSFSGYIDVLNRELVGLDPCSN